MNAKTAEVTIHVSPVFLEEPSSQEFVDALVARKFEALGTLTTTPRIVHRETESEGNEYGVPAGSERRTYRADVEPAASRDTP